MEKRRRDVGVGRRRGGESRSGVRGVFRRGGDADVREGENGECVRFRCVERWRFGLLVERARGLWGVWFCTRKDDFRTRNRCFGGRSSAVRGGDGGEDEERADRGVLRVVVVR